MLAMCMLIYLLPLYINEKMYFHMFIIKALFFFLKVSDFFLYIFSRENNNSNKIIDVGQWTLEYLHKIKSSPKIFVTHEKLLIL